MPRKTKRFARVREAKTKTMEQCAGLSRNALFEELSKAFVENERLHEELLRNGVQMDYMQRTIELLEKKLAFLTRKDKHTFTHLDKYDKRRTVYARKGK